MLTFANGTYAVGGAPLAAHGSFLTDGGIITCNTQSVDHDAATVSFDHAMLLMDFADAQQPHKTATYGTLWSEQTQSFIDVPSQPDRADERQLILRQASQLTHLLFPGFPLAGIVVGTNVARISPMPRWCQRRCPQAGSLETADVSSVRPA